MYYRICEEATEAMWDFIADAMDEMHQNLKKIIRKRKIKNKLCIDDITITFVSNDDSSLIYNINDDNVEIEIIACGKRVGATAINQGDFEDALYLICRLNEKCHILPKNWWLEKTKG